MDSVPNRACSLTYAARVSLPLLSLFALTACGLVPGSGEHTAATLSANAASRAQAGSTDMTDVAVEAANIAAKQAIAMAKQNNPSSWMSRTDAQVTFKKSDDPTFSLETINPIKQDALNTTFWQGRLASQDSEQTVNLGLGYRRLVANKTWLVGANAFADRAIQQEHQRYGLGLEAFGPRSTLRYNHYNATSDEKVIANNAGVKILALAQSGWDVGVETPIPYTKNATLALTHYHWEGVNQADIQGRSLAVRLNPTSNLAVEIGAQDDNTNDTRGFANLSWSFGKKAQRRQGATRDVSQQRLAKVRRHNDIVVEKRTSGSVIITLGRGT